MEVQMVVTFMPTWIKALAIAWLLLLIGDFFSTFGYHIPEHVFGKLHLQTHHATKQGFRHYAVLRPNAKVLLDGFLGALPYLLLAPALAHFSWVGVVLGLLLGQLHVWWRHTNALGWQTPSVVQQFCHLVRITTPEQHWQHHQKINQGFGDIFTWFDQPAKIWFRWLRWLRFYLRSRLILSN